MTKLRIAIGSVVTGVWVLGYLMAFFVDRTLEGLAQSATPLMLLVVGFLFGAEAAAIFRGGDKK